MSELLHCPFCGGRNVFQRDDDPHHVWIECDDCQIGTLGTDCVEFGGDVVATCKAARDAWNSRSHREAETGVITQDMVEQAWITYVDASTSPTVTNHEAMRAVLEEAFALASPQRETEEKSGGAS